MFDSTPIVYSASLLHWLPFFALGVVLADVMLSGRPLSPWWLAGVVASVAYLGIVHVDNDAFPLSNEDWKQRARRS